jgi:hypothetical protein
MSAGRNCCLYAHEIEIQYVVLCSLSLSAINGTISTASGMSPSGKALVSGTSIRGFESLHPSQDAYA